MNFNEGGPIQKAASIHDVAGNDTSFFEDVAVALGNTPDFLHVSLASGLNSFYNTGLAVANLFEDDKDKLAYNDTGEWISSYDDDLGKYYAKNKAGADLTGFIAGSLLPGLGAIKALNLAQTAARSAVATGQIGSNFSRMTRLLAPSMETYVQREAADLAAKSATFSFANTNALRALGSGVQQGVLESLAFETAVALTMFKSPVLDDLTAGELIKSVGMYTALGGAIGAVGAIARTYSGVSTLLKNANSRQKIATSSNQLAEGTRDADKIIQASVDRSLISGPVTAEFVLAAKLKQKETGFSISNEAVQAEVVKLNSLRIANVERFGNEIRTSTRKLVGEDEFGNQVAELTGRLTPGQFHSTFFNMTEMTRLGTTTKYEQKVAELKRAGFTKAQIAIELSNRGINYVRMHSGTLGDIIPSKPGLTRLADKFPKAKVEALATGAGKFHTAPVDFRTIAVPKGESLADAVEARWIGARSHKLGVSAQYKFGDYDLPMLDLAVSQAMPKVTLVSGRTLEGAKQIKDYLVAAKHEVFEVQKQAKRGTHWLERITDMRADYLEGRFVVGAGDDAFFAQQSYARELSTFLGSEVTPLALHYRPAFGKAVYDLKDSVNVDQMTLKGTQLIAYRSKLAAQAVDNVFAKWAGDVAVIFPEIPRALLQKAWIGGSGAGFATNAGGVYGSLESMTSYIGNLTSELTELRIKQLTTAFSPVATKLASSSEDAVRFSVVNELVSNTPEKYVLNETGTALVPRKVRDWEVARLSNESYAEPYPTLFPGTLEEIPLETQLLRDAVALHIKSNGDRVLASKELNAALGQTDEKFADTFYPTRPNPKDHPYVAFVKDESLIGVGHTRMLFAKDADTLEAQIHKVEAASHHYKVYTKGRSEAFYDARGEWLHSNTLHENYLDTDLLSRGIYSRFIPQTDPVKIVRDWVGDHVASENRLIKQMVLAKYQQPIAELRRLGEQFSDISSSKIGSAEDLLVSDKKNPYVAQIKAMLNVTKIDEYPMLRSINERLDSVVSKAVAKVDEVIRGSKTIGEGEIERINNVMDDLGFKSAYHDSMTYALANSTIPRGSLTSFVRTANAFLTATMLRLDPFNALNNLLGNTVLFSTELNSLIRSIREQSPEAAGALAKLGDVRIVGTDASMLSPTKLIAGSLARLHGPQRDALIAEYTKRGLNPDLSNQYFKAIDVMTLRGNETDAILEAGKRTLRNTLTEFTRVGEKVTGNRAVEQFNRLLAADVAKQITELGVKHGVIDERAAWTYVNTFVNRTQGVIRAAERPLMFQGPIGQAVGLFQSYQFNLIQQTMRYIGEGKGKQLAMLAGLQGSIYGASSLPAFNLINYHLIGKAAGNTEHNDLYSSTQKVFGREGAEWIMYGVPSNILNASLYSRGDTNPRTWSIVPNPLHPTEIPFISSFIKAFGSTLGTVNKIAGGAPVAASLLSGIEHLGLSRPLAGIAQTARAGITEDGKVLATQRNGSIIASNDFASWATVTRMAGAKPLDQAIMQGNYYRLNSYRMYDDKKKEALGSRIKETLLGGGSLTAEQVEETAERYVELGGSQTGYNRWMLNLYKDTSVSQAEQLAQHLNSPYSRQMQLLLGGRDSLEDLE